MLKQERTPEEIEAEYNKKCAEHPEYTEDQKVCLMYSLNVRKSCEVSPERLAAKQRYNVFIKEHPEVSGMTEGNIQPLVSEQDPEIQQKVVTLVAKAGSRKGELYGTREKIQDTIARYRYVEPEAKADTTNITATPYFFAQKVEKFIKWCFTQREEEVIREVIDKAIVNSR